MIMAIRAAFCQALGISPIIGIEYLNLNRYTDTATCGTTPQYPSVQDIIASKKDFFQSTMQGEEDNATLFDLKNQSLGSITDPNMQILLRYNVIQEPVDVQVVVPSSLLKPQDLSCIVQLTRPNSLILQLFTQEEIDTICLLTSYAFNIPHKVTPKQLIALASRSFSMIIISDSTTADWGRIEFANAVRHSVSD